MLGFLSKRGEKLIGHSFMAQLWCVLPSGEQSLVHLRREMVSIMEIAFIVIEPIHLQLYMGYRVAVQLVLISLLVVIGLMLVLALI